MNRRLAWMGFGAALSLFVVGCNDGEGTIGEGRGAQVVEGYGDWKRYTATLENDVLFAEILVIAGQDQGDYEANTEYWYVNTSSLQYLGSNDLTFTSVEGTGKPDDPSGDQEFELPALVTWSSFSSDPVSSGYLFSRSNVHLRVHTDSGAVTNVAWYQTLASGSAANVAPDGTFEYGSGSLSIPSGHTGYRVSQAVP